MVNWTERLILTFITLHSRNGVSLHNIAATIDGTEMFSARPCNRHYAEIMKQVKSTLTIQDAD